MGTLPGVRVLVIVNPRATAISVRERDVLTHALASEADVQVEETANRGHAAALACRGMRNGADVVVALGGDGTVNEVINGLLTDGVHPRIPWLGVVPTGSTNVFARALGLPSDPIEATGACLTPCGNTAIGRSASVASMTGGSRSRPASASTRRSWPGSSGPADAAGARPTPYMPASACANSSAMDRRHPTLHLELPDGTVVDGLFYAIVANTDPWTYVGNRALRPTPGATFDTGLDVYARRRMSLVSATIGLARMARAEPKSVGRGAILRHDLPGLLLRADAPILVQVDGDLLGPRDTMQFWSIPHALTVLS